jgi:phosphoribosylanthranilate isomerase
MLSIAKRRTTPSPARTMKTLVKICGLSTAEALDTALAAGADMVGFVCFDKSPRNLSFEKLRFLCARVSDRADKVVLTVDADDAALAAIAAAEPAILQLHGRETPERVAAIRERFGLKVMKAIPVAEVADLAQIEVYAPVADMLLFDARPPATAEVPGGNGLSFDWRLLQGLAFRGPWLLAGGLDEGNVGEALAITQAPGVDVSSGVEAAPGVKDAGKIRDFLAAVRATEKLGWRQGKG